MCLAQISQRVRCRKRAAPGVYRRWPRRAVVEHSQSAGDPANFPQYRTGLVRHGDDAEQETYIERVELERETLSGGLHDRHFEERMSALHRAGRRVHRHDFTSPMTS